MQIHYEPWMIPGITVDMIAKAILTHDNLYVSAYTQEWLRYNLPFAELPKPETNDPNVLIVAAGVVELLATRANQTPPTWVHTVGSLDEPFFVMRVRPGQDSYTRQLCLNEAPEPLKRRNIFSPPNYLTFA
jgi:hypothetical protein